MSFIIYSSFTKLNWNYLEAEYCKNSIEVFLFTNVSVKLMTYDASVFSKSCLTEAGSDRFAENRLLPKRDPRRIAEMKIGDLDRIAEK